MAGDGVFTFDRLYTRAYSDFWAQYADRGFPLEVPIRVIVKDKSDNYTFADAQLLVTDDPADIPPPDDDGDEGDGDDEVVGPDGDGVDDDDGGDDLVDDGSVDGDDGADDEGVGDGHDGGDEDDEGSRIQPGGGDDVNGDEQPADGNQSPLDDGLGGLMPTINVCPTTASMMLALTVAGLLMTQPRCRR